jgi:two-component sensor histidine kinase
MEIRMKPWSEIAAMSIGPFQDLASGSLLAQAVVESIREPLLVLDGELRVIATSRSFHSNFHVAAEDVVGRSIFDGAGARFDAPIVRSLLRAAVTTHGVAESCGFNATFPLIGARALVLDARAISDERRDRPNILMTIQDVTDRLAIENATHALLNQSNERLRQKEIRLQEIQHRVANSLQIIASILMMKARLVTSAEIRGHLEDAHQRVLSVATMQEHILAAGRVDQIAIRPYLSRLCENLAASMVGEGGLIACNVQADEGAVPSADAVSIGLIVTELVINSLKHAFPGGHPGARVLVNYESRGADWRLVVSDNGVGKPDASAPAKRAGLGANLVAGLAGQLDARVELVNHPDGLKVSVIRAGFDSELSVAA